MAESPNLEDALREWLVEIDGQLEAAHVPIPNRVHDAAVFFVTHCIEEISGDTKDDFLVKPWFKAIYKATEEWYRDKYAAALERPKDALEGAALVSGAIFTIHVPRTLSRVEKVGETAWLIFPADVQDGEDPLDWMVTPPNLLAMDDDSRDAVRLHVGEIGTCLRTTHVDLMTTKRPDPDAERLANKILPHLKAAAVHLADPHVRSLGLAAWDAHQAVESVLKLLCRQRSGRHKKTHELSDLHAALGKKEQNGIDVALLQGMPDKNRIVEMRAGEGAAISLSLAHAVYMRSIKLVRQCTGVSDNPVRVRNAELLLKKAPYID